MNSAPRGRTAEFHRMLLRVAGWVPDEVTHALRQRLAANPLVELAQAAAFAALAHRCPVAPEDAALLHNTLSEVGQDTKALAELDLVPVPGLPWYAMSAVDPRRLTGQPDEAPSSVDLTDAAGGSHDHDSMDRAAVGAARDPGPDATAAEPIADLVAVAVWRCWRSPAITTPYPPPRRLYLVQAETGDPDRMPMLTARVQAALVRAGEPAPQVEVFADSGELPAYQRAALGWSALLWTSRPTPTIQVSELFDPVDEVGGPGFTAARPTLDGDEREQVLAYLDGGSPLLTTTAKMDDVVDPARHGSVSIGFSTDGHWVWTDAAAYYLRHHRVAPDPRLLAHVRGHRYEVPPVDAIAKHRAMAALEAMAAGDR